jgi:hypothetical protein
VLVRLVQGYQRFIARGQYVTSDEALAADDSFARQADRVLLFIYETCTVSAAGWVSRQSIGSAFDEWCGDNRRLGMTRPQLYRGIEGAGYQAKQGTESHLTRGVRGFERLTLRDRSDWGPPEPPEAKEAPHSRPSDGEVVVVEGARIEGSFPKKSASFASGPLADIDWDGSPETTLW